jgi:hypothetical protein
MRRPETLFQAEFFADDSMIYQQGFNILKPYGGSHLLLQRLLTLPQLVVPPYWAPVVANATALLATATVAAFIASCRLASVLPERRQRLGLALLFVLLPGSYEVLGTMSHLQWITGAFLLALVVANPGSRWELPIVALACLTGPIVLFVLPLFAVRWWRYRDSALFAVVIACAAFQLGTLWFHIGDRPGPEAIDPTLVPAVWLTRVLHTPIELAICLLGLVLIATADASWTWRVVVGIVVVAIPVAGLLQSAAPTAQFLDQVSAGRYFWLSTAVLVASVVMVRPVRIAPRWARRLAVIAIAALFVTNAHIRPLPYMNWAANSSCLGTSRSCLVPVWPDRFWWIRWSGEDYL